MTHPTSSGTTFNDEELDALQAKLRNGDQMDGKTVNCKHDQCNCALLCDADDAITALRAQLATLQLHLDSTNDKLEIERALTDGAHRRAREAEAEAHACGAEREAWKTRADRAEQRVATLEAALDEIKQMLGAPDEWHPVYAVKALKQSCYSAEAALVAQIDDACAVIDAHSEYDQSLCCDGRECGCQGASVHDTMKHFIRQPHDSTAIDRMLAEHEVRLREAREISEAEKIAIRNKALREAAEICSNIRQRIASGPMPEGARFDYEQSILALINKDKEN